MKQTRRDVVFWISECQVVFGSIFTETSKEEDSYWSKPQQTSGKTAHIKISKASSVYRHQHLIRRASEWDGRGILGLPSLDDSLKIHCCFIYKKMRIVFIFRGRSVSDLVSQTRYCEQWVGFFPSDLWIGINCELLAIFHEMNWLLLLSGGNTMFFKNIDSWMLSVLIWCDLTKK